MYPLGPKPWAEWTGRPIHLLQDEDYSGNDCDECVFTGQCFFR